MNGFTRGVESQPFPLVHRAIGDSRVMASMKTGLDNSAAAQAVKIAIAPTMGYARRLGSTADEFPVSFAVYGRI
jgi:hypothetical protein